MNPYSGEPVDPNDPYSGPPSPVAPPGYGQPSYGQYGQPSPYGPDVPPGYPPADYRPSYPQSNYPGPDYSQPTYAGPTYPQPTYAGPTYPQPTYPGPAYAPPGYQPGLYAPPPYPPSYYPQPGGRPGQVIAAAVLGYVVAGLLVIAALICFAGANELDNLGYPDNGFLVVGGFGNLIVAGLLIAGGVLLTAGRSRGRTLYTAGSLLDGLLAILWLTRGSTALVWVVLFIAPIVVGLSLGWQVTTTRWLAASQPVTREQQR